MALRFSPPSSHPSSYFANHPSGPAIRSRGKPDPARANPAPPSWAFDLRRLEGT